MTEEVKVNVNEEETKNEESTVTVAEMKRRLAKLEETKQQEIEELNKRTEESIKAAVEKAQEEARLSGKELAEYQEKERQRKYQEELDKRDEQIAELTRKERQREIKDESIKKLNELNIDVNSESLDLINDETLDGMSSKAEKLSNLLKTYKNKYAQSDAPLVSGGKNIKTKHESEFGILDSNKITKF